jgi:hypothetical protein
MVEQQLQTTNIQPMVVPIGEQEIREQLHHLLSSTPLQQQRL